MRKLILYTLACLLYGCNTKIQKEDYYHTVNDLERRDLLFWEADTVHDFQRSGDFAVVGDTVVVCDYYFKYNDGRELSKFMLNTNLQERMIEYKDKGPIELNVAGKILHVFRRGYDAIFETYDMQDLHQGKETIIKEIHFKNVDHLVETDSFFIASAIIEGKGILNIYNKDGQWKKSLDPFEENLDAIATADKRYIIGQGHLSYNSKHHFLVYATVYTGDIFIYNIEGCNLELKRHISIGKGLPNDKRDFKVKSSTWIYAKDICNDSDYVYVLCQDAKVTANLKGCNILRIEHDGKVICLKGYIPINRIKVADGFLYGIGNRNGENHPHLYKAKLY